MRRTSMLRACSLLFVLAVPAVLAGSARAAGEAIVERWYENLHNGKKTGWIHVVWTESKWEGHATVHDRTTVSSRSVRDMLGTKDEFVSSSTLDIERGEDGLLWWQRSVSEEKGRLITEEWKWTGSAYEIVVEVDGAENKITIPLDERVAIDAEAFLGKAIRAKELAKGQRLTLRILDVAARAVRTNDLEVLGTESVESEAGEVACIAVRQSDPLAHTSSVLWLDDQGGVVQIRDDGGGWVRRRSREVAEAAPEVVAENSITTESHPGLERIFSADKVRLDLHVSPDSGRSLPAFPESPWSREVGRTGDDENGWVYDVELRKYDSQEVHGTLPVDRVAFARDLEATGMMQVDHAELLAKAHEVVGEEKDLRAAAYALARWVFLNLEKRSLDVQQGSALQILRDCRGDCSEHALLFVALCRAAGIPARICSGYVCVGGDWGAHSWAEIWTGQWISADPTTGEVGGGARYLFFGYPDRAGSFPGVVSTRAQGRMDFYLRRVEEGDQAWDLSEDVSTWYVRDPEAGRYQHVLLGIEARDVPEGWRVHMSERGPKFRITGPDDLSVTIHAQADQGYDLDALGPVGRSTTFAGVPARVMSDGGDTYRYFLISRRRIFRMEIQVENLEQLTEVEKVLAPTFAERPIAWPKTAGVDSKDD